MDRRHHRYPTLSAEQQYGRAEQREEIMYMDNIGFEVVQHLRQDLGRALAPEYLSGNYSLLGDRKVIDIVIGAFEPSHAMPRAC